MTRASHTMSQAIDLINRGDSVGGRAVLEGLHEANPADAHVSLALAKLDAEEGHFDRALSLFEPLLDVPELARQAAVLIVHTLTTSRRAEEAARRAALFHERYHQQFRSQSPPDPSLALHAAAAHSTLGDFESAARLLRSQFDFAKNPEVASALSSALLNLGRIDEAVVCLRETLEAFPADVGCLAALANASNFTTHSREEGVRLHRAFARIVEFATPATDPLSFVNSPDPERPIRIALLSFDFRAHSVAYFIEAVLRHHDRARYHITAYSTSATQDAVTERLRPLADAWKTDFRAAPRLLARDIFADKPDIAIELGGLTGGSPLPAMVPPVAPVQVSAVGYPNTTGFKSIQYRLVDSLTDPPGEADRVSPETLVRLDPCFLCFTPRLVRQPRRAPVVEGFTFGCFNKVTKYSDRCLQLWTRILQRVPDARLILKSPALDSADARGFLSARLRGAPLDRIEFKGRQADESDHLAMYEHVDLALDTFPYNGTTTTCEALLMGVPVLTLAGTTHAGRVGVSLLSAAGFLDSIAASPDEYVEKAVAAAANASALRAGRRAVSEQLLASPLCDGAAYARRWQDAIRTLWRSWCERKRNQSSSSARR